MVAPTINAALAQVVELLPCPFCGSPAELEEDTDHHGGWFNLGCSKHWGNTAVKEDEHCPGGRLWYTAEPEEMEKAIAQWNARPALSSLLEGLKERAAGDVLAGTRSFLSRSRRGNED